MARKLVSATVMAALLTMSSAPALAQDYRFAGFDAPRGASATLNLRVPLGARPGHARASYGLTLGYGREMAAPGYDGTMLTRGVRLADLRFSGAGTLSTARLASFDLAARDRGARRSHLGASVPTTWIIVGLVAVGVGACVIAGCFGGGDDSAM
jgi:hypothetical protein